jgi:hypothetical protein
MILFKGGAPLHLECCEEAHKSFITFLSLSLSITDNNCPKREADFLYFTVFFSHKRRS